MEKTEDDMIDISKEAYNNGLKQKEHYVKGKEQIIHNALGPRKHAVERKITFALTVGNEKSS